MSEVSLPNVLNVPFVEELYTEFVRDPQAVSEDWRRYFQTLEEEHNGNGKLGPSFQAESLFHVPRLVQETAAREQVRAFGAQDRVDQLIRVYRMRGHIIAQIDPLG